MVANGATYNITLAARVEGDLARLTTQLGQVQRELRQVDRQVAQTKANVSKNGDWFASVRDGARGLLATLGAISIGQYIFDATARVQQFTESVKSFTSSSAVAEQAWKDVQSIAARGFSIDPLLRAEQTMLSLGYNLKDSKEYVEAIAKIGSSTNPAAFDRISLAMTQIAAKGKVSLEEIRQLGEAGVPALAIFAKAAGMSASEFQKAASQGKILSEDVLPEVIKQIDALYGDAYAARADTLFGNFGKAQVDLQNLSNTWGTQLTPAINIGLKAASGFLQVAQLIPPQMAILGFAAARWGGSTMTALRGVAAQTATWYGLWRQGAGSFRETTGAMLAGLGKVKASLIAIAAVAVGATVAGAFKPEDAANIDLVAASIKNLNDTQNLGALSSIKYMDRFGEMMNTVANPSLIKRAEDGLAAIVGIIGIGPGRAKDTAEFLNNVKQVDAVLAQMGRGQAGDRSAAAQAYDQFVAAAQAQGVSMEDIIKMFPQYQGVLAGIKAGTIQAADATGELADKTKIVSDAYGRLADNVTAPGRSFLSAAKIVQSYADSLTNAKDAIEKGKTVTSKERGALLDLAGAALDVAESQIKAGKGVDVVYNSMKKARSDFLKTADAMGIGAKEAKKLADNVGLVPEEVKTKFQISGLAALQAAEASVKGLYSAAGIGYTGGAAYNLYIQQQTKFIATQTIPVRVMNPQDLRSGSSGANGRTTGSGGGTGTGRMGAIPVARVMPTRMVSV